MNFLVNLVQGRFRFYRLAPIHVHGDTLCMSTANIWKQFFQEHKRKKHEEGENTATFRSFQKGNTHAFPKNGRGDAR